MPMAYCRLCIRLRRALRQRLREGRALTDPRVLAASRRLDGLIIRVMRDPTAPCTSLRRSGQAGACPDQCKT